jgi:protein subunit release factor A
MKDCTMNTFSVSGAGGQHRDHSNSGVRIVHNASGAVGEATDSRKQSDNKKAAFKRMAQTDTFQRWAKNEVRKHPDYEQMLNEAMRPENIIVEIKVDGKWGVELD